MNFLNSFRKCFQRIFGVNKIVSESIDADNDLDDVLMWIIKRQDKILFQLRIADIITYKQYMEWKSNE